MGRYGGNIIFIGLHCYNFSCLRRTCVKISVAVSCIGYHARSVRFEFAGQQARRLISASHGTLLHLKSSRRVVKGDDQRGRGAATGAIREAKRQPKGRQKGRRGDKRGRGATQGAIKELRGQSGKRRGNQRAKEAPKGAFKLGERQSEGETSHPNWEILYRPYL